MSMRCYRTCGGYVQGLRQINVGGREAVGGGVQRGNAVNTPAMAV